MNHPVKLSFCFLISKLMNGKKSTNKFSTIWRNIQVIYCYLISKTFAFHSEKIWLSLRFEELKCQKFGVFCNSADDFSFFNICEFGTPKVKQLLTKNIFVGLYCFTTSQTISFKGCSSFKWMYSVQSKKKLTIIFLPQALQNQFLISSWLLVHYDQTFSF